MTDILDNPFDPFADAVEAALEGFRKDTAGLRAELATALTEVRSLRAELETRAAPVIQPPEPIDVEAIATRAAALVPVPVVKDGDPGKDAVVDYSKIAEDVRGFLAPMVTAEVAKIPAPSVDLDTVARSAAALIPKPKDGEDGTDGIATREEIESIVERAVIEVQTRSLADYHRGVYVRDKRYERGSVTQFDGSAWLANADTDGVPGVSSDWVILAKKGRDARR